MVTGFNSFKNHFQDYKNQYIIIGGTACDLIMSSEDIPFRSTKDIDMVLIVEALTPGFVQKFWDYIREAEYKHQNQSTGEPQFYRFSHPKSKLYPAMIELFSRKIDSITFVEGTNLTPLPIDDEVSSLSAILLNDEYYDFLLRGKTLVDEIPVLRPEYIIPFKAKAWLDLTARKENGEQIDSRNIRKHKNDVLRLSVFLTKETNVNKETIDLKSLGLIENTPGDLFNLLHMCYLHPLT